jgi:hypothetical protein
MSVWHWVAITVAAVLLAYVFFLIWLVIAGRKAEARTVGGFVPDFVKLFRRLLADRRVPRRKRSL